ncbi:MAG: hypothetical protein ABIH11_09210 [Candidatus Altiarchaeota archaeon]
MKNISIDENAHKILLWAKNQCIREGIERPSLSDAVRQLKNLSDSQAHKG